MAELIVSNCWRTCGLSCKCPWRSNESTRVGKNGTRRLAQMRLAATQARCSASWTGYARSGEDGGAQSPRGAGLGD